MPPPSRGSRAQRGHRVLPHTADLVIEAWATTREGCFEEAVLALVGAFADTSGTEPSAESEIAVPPQPDDAELVVQVLEEVIVLGEVEGMVPVGATVRSRDDGGLSVRFAVVPVASVDVVGAVPKAVARSDLLFEREADRWRCRATIDV